MRYKTTIEIVAEAENKSDAIEIVSEYLSGDIITGVDMKCVTRPVSNYKAAAAIFSVIISLALVTVLSVYSGKTTQGMSSTTTGISAIQPPLKTSIGKSSSGFKNEWTKKQAKEALNKIKSIR